MTGLQNYQEFDSRLLTETQLLEKWFTNQVFSERELAAGSEIEFFLLSHDYNPAPDNLIFIDKARETQLVPEVGKAHLEINSKHTYLTRDCLRILHQDILRAFRKCCVEAKKSGYHLALTGSLPTATEEHHQAIYLTDKERYHILNGCMKEQSAGLPVQIKLEGKETLCFKPASLAINGLISAFQLHIQIGLSQSVRYYNTAQAITGPMMALTCNSPFILGKQVFADTRVFLFDEMMTLPRFDRAQGFKSCTFGTGYLRDSFFELFEENYRFFPRLMPVLYEEDPLEKMTHVRLQNGVIYRWNRPVVDFNYQGKPHLRIEHRAPSSGPTIVDMVANAAFFYGLVQYFANCPTPIEYLLPFSSARENFYHAARYGMEADFTWFLGKKISAAKLLKQLIPYAKKGLQSLGIAREDIAFYLGIIKKRVHAKTNGSHWQVQFVEKYGPDFHGMLELYLQNQYEEIPVHEWKI